MKHLDIGSGLKPENPYGADELYGIDIQDNIHNIPNYKSVNLFTNNWTYVGENSPIENLFNNWHHIVGTYDGDTVKLYMDGVLLGQDIDCGINSPSTSI